MKILPVYPEFPDRRLFFWSLFLLALIIFAIYDFHFHRVAGFDT